MSDTESRAITRLDWLLIGILIALVLPLRLWLLHNTEVTARDSIGYIRYALRLEREPWKKVMTESHQHPGYPVIVLAASLPVRAIDGATTPENLALTTQLTSFVASLLLAAVIYLLGRQFFDRPISFVAALIYQYLPISAQHLSDGISEPVYLLLLIGGLLQGIHAVRTCSAWRGAFAGLFTGLAYLVRPEGALILPAFGLTLLALQCRAAWRSPWGQFLRCGTAMTLTAVLVGSILFAITGKITTKPGPREMMHLQACLDAPAGTLFAASFQPSTHATVEMQRSLVAIGSEIGQGFHYVAVVPALIGMWWFAGGLRRNPGFWLLAVYCMLHAAVLIRLGMSVHYVSDRHVMIFVIFGCCFVAAGLLELPRRVLTAWKGDLVLWQRSSAAWSAVLVLALLVVCLPKAMHRLHGNREANHAAGLWLADKLQVGDHVEDDHSWTAFYSGHTLREGEDPVLPATHVPTTYVVTTSSHDTLLNGKRHSEKIAPGARVVRHWPEHVEDVKKARVVIYAQPRDPKVNPWRKAPQALTVVE